VANTGEDSVYRVVRREVKRQGTVRASSMEEVTAALWDARMSEG